jgi:ATP-dependent DNA helicase PIF1
LALHGSTIHKFIGYGKNTNSLPKILNHEYWDRIADRLNDPDIVIIDEISMVNSEIIDLLDQIFRKATKNDKPFGGKIVVFCGDFLQLPPVTTDSKDSDEIWAFNSKI